MFDSFIGIIWETFSSIYDRTARVKFVIDYHDNFLRSYRFKDGYRLTSVHSFSIINIGREDIIIRSISFQIDNAKGTHLSPFSTFPCNEYFLQPKREFCYFVDHNTEEFGHVFDKCNAKRFRVLVEDTTRKIFKSKWVTLNKQQTALASILSDAAVGLDFFGGFLLKQGTCYMNEPQTIPVTFDNKNYEFEATLVPYGYLHRFIINVEGIELAFEMDEERYYRVLDMSDGKPAMNSIKPGLLQAIVDMLQSLHE